MTDPMQVLQQTDKGTTNTVPMQQTVARPVSISGKGLLLGNDVDMSILPAPAGEGIIFERIDIEPAVQIPALIANTTERARRTALSASGVTIETIEHLMSALSGLDIDNALIQLNGSEVPCGDGSALPFVEILQKAGTVVQDQPRRIFQIVDPICLQEGDAMIAAFPSNQASLHVVYDLDYGESSSRIAQQMQAWNSTNGAYAKEIAPARTYSLEEEAQELQAKGMCVHLTPADILVIGDDGPIDNEYRFDNEPVRHKILDIIGDLYLAGAHIQGRIVASRSGHSLNRRLCKVIVEQNKVVRRT